MASFLIVFLVACAIMFALAAAASYLRSDKILVWVYQLMAILSMVFAVVIFKEFS